MTIARAFTPPQRAKDGQDPASPGESFLRAGHMAGAVIPPRHIR